MANTFARLVPNDTKLAALAFWSAAVVPFVVVKLVSHEWAAAGAAILALLPALAILWLRVQRGRMPRAAVMVPMVTVINAVVIVAAARLPAEPSYWVFPFLILNFLLLGVRFGGSLSLVLIAAGTLNLWSGGAPDSAFAFLKAGALAFVFLLLVSRTLVDNWLRMEQLAHVDPLTGLANRRALEQTLRAMDAEGGGAMVPASVILMDLDHFKALNDRFGHLRGDSILALLAENLADWVRRDDRVFRFGGEEFLIVAPRTDAPDALRLAERIRGRVQALKPQDALRLTLSCGVAERHASEPAEQWLERADRALYRAKNNGRNRCCSAN